MLLFNRITRFTVRFFISLLVAEVLIWRVCDLLRKHPLGDSDLVFKINGYFTHLVYKKKQRTRNLPPFRDLLNSLKLNQPEIDV